jgi:hypothetical protein
MIQPCGRAHPGRVDASARKKEVGMGRATLFVTLLVGALLLPAGSSAQYQIQQSVVGCGGGGAAGATNRIVGTVGQAVVGLVSGTANLHEIGFWYQTQPGASAAPEVDPIPLEFALGPGIPSPGRQQTTLRFSVPRRAAVAIRLYDVTGRELLTLTEREIDPGVHTLVLDGSGLAGGIYFCRMTAERFVATRRLVWVK